MMASPLLQWLLSPLNRWSLASPVHKALSLAAGAGVAYYCHTRKGWTPAKVAAAGVGSAYGASLVLHTLQSGGLAGLLGAQPGMAGMQPGMAGMQPQMPMQGQMPAGLPAAPQGQPMGNVVDMRSRVPVARAAGGAQGR